MANENGTETTPGQAGRDEDGALAIAQPVDMESSAVGQDRPHIDVSLNRTPIIETPDQALWSAIRNRTNAIGFERYSNFINAVLCEEKEVGRPACDSADIQPSPDDPDISGDIGSPSFTSRRDELNMRPSIYGVDSYQLLKLATQAFLLLESGVVIRGPRDPDTGEFIVPDPGDAEALALEEKNRYHRPVDLGVIQRDLEAYLTQGVGNLDGRSLPYLQRIVSALPSLTSSNKEGLPYCKTILQHRYSCPSLIELIWSYWHEEGMLVQTMNAITMRFQNMRNGPQDPLVNLALDPLRPLSNLMWGFVQDERSRLNIQRRNYEYQNHYGVNLIGKAVDKIEPADSRSKFIEAFHNLLHRTAMFYREDDDTTVIADAFSLLNSLREVHLILAEGAHNQFGDLPWTARVEMLTMEWLLARPEMREFIRGRHSVPYQETWMGAVDDMKRLQGWTDVTITHFRELGVHGEQILLAIRYADWIVENDQERARNWARYWRPEIQRYLHAYFATTGVDLTADVTDTRNVADRYLQPSVHLKNRLPSHQEQKSLPSARSAGKLGELTNDYLDLPVPRRRNRLLARNRDD